MSKPLITIDEFAGMGDDGLFWLENASVKKINGKTIITPTFYQAYFIDKSITNFADLSECFNCIASFQMQQDSANLDADYLVGIDSQKIFGFHNANSNAHKGLMHMIAPTGSGTDQIHPCSYPAVFETKENNLLYSSSNHLGLGIKGLCKTGSTNAKIIDKAGRNFATLGASTSFGSNKVYNTRGKEIYTITSITTTTATNDTLNFTAGTGDNAEDEEFILFVDNKFKFEVSYKTGNHFKNQTSPIYWKRQILLWGDYYWALNGNWLSNLKIDETTWAYNAKQLPYNCQAVCFSVNASKMLVGCEEKDKGKVILWDSYSNGWLNEINLERKPISIKPFKQGWIVSTGASLYYTDGYIWELIAEYPDSQNYWNFAGNFDAMIIIDDLIFHICENANFNRMKNGICVYDLKSGWSYVPINSSDGDYAYIGTQGALYANTRFGANTIPITSCQVDGITNSNTINKIYFLGGSKYNFIYYLKLPKMMNISRIQLNVMLKLSMYSTINQNVSLTVAYGDGKDGVMNYFQCRDTGNTTTKIINNQGNYHPAKVGEEIFATHGKCCGERTFITAIANPGTADEELTISPALSEIIIYNTWFSRLRLKRAGDKRTFDPTDIPEDLSFEVGDLLTDKLFIEVVVDNRYNNKLDIHSIDLF